MSDVLDNDALLDATSHVNDNTGTGGKTLKDVNDEYNKVIRAKKLNPRSKPSDFNAAFGVTFTTPAATTTTTTTSGSTSGAVKVGSTAGTRSTTYAPVPMKKEVLLPGIVKAGSLRGEADQATTSRGM